MSENPPRPFWKKETDPELRKLSAPEMRERIVKHIEKTGLQEKVDRAYEEAKEAADLSSKFSRFKNHNPFKEEAKRLGELRHRIRDMAAGEFAPDFLTQFKNLAFGLDPDTRIFEETTVNPYFRSGPTESELRNRLALLDSVAAFYDPAPDVEQPRSIDHGIEGVSWKSLKEQRAIQKKWIFKTKEEKALLKEKELHLEKHPQIAEEAIREIKKRRYRPAPVAAPAPERKQTIDLHANPVKPEPLPPLEDEGAELFDPSAIDTSEHEQLDWNPPTKPLVEGPDETHERGVDGERVFDLDEPGEALTFDELKEFLRPNELRFVKWMWSIPDRPEVVEAQRDLEDALGDFLSGKIDEASLKEYAMKYMRQYFTDVEGGVEGIRSIMSETERVVAEAKAARKAARKAKKEQPLEPLAPTRDTLAAPKKKRSPNSDDNSKLIRNIIFSVAAGATAAGGGMYFANRYKTEPASAVRVVEDEPRAVPRNEAPEAPSEAIKEGEQAPVVSIGEASEEADYIIESGGDQGRPAPTSIEP